MKVVIAGSNGFLGQALVEAFGRAGSETLGLVRQPDVPGTARWDGKTLGPWAKELEGADAVINLAGYPVAKRWTPKNRKLILDSRVQSARAIGQAVERCQTPPKVWINGSAAGYYGDTGDREVDEQSPPGEGFLADVCKAWEAAAEVDGASTRKVVVRTGFPLGVGGGLKTLVTLTKFFLGGAAGSGAQFVPWIHIDDLCRLFRWCVEDASVPAAVNGVGPNPLPNKELMAALRRTLGRPWAPPVPAFALKLFAGAAGLQADPILQSARVLPGAARDGGFKFGHPDLEEALKSLLRP